MRPSRWLITLAISAAATFSIGVGALWGFVERMGVDRVLLSTPDGGQLLSISVIFMLAGSLAASALGVRLGRTLPLVFSMAICGVAVLATSAASTYWPFAVGIMVYSFFYLFVTPYIIAGTSSELDPTGRLGSAIGGITFLFYAAGIGVGGYVVEAYSLSAIGWLGLVSCCLAAAIYACLAQIRHRAELDPQPS